MKKEMQNKSTNFIASFEIDTIEYHQTLQCYLVILHDHKGIWYCKEFTANKEGLKGDFREDRF